MKYTYVYDDWNLFHVEEVEVVRSVLMDEYPLPVERYAVIKDGEQTKYVPERLVFDTYAEAYQYGAAQIVKPDYLEHFE